jgi:hypothetical protein
VPSHFATVERLACVHVAFSFGAEPFLGPPDSNPVGSVVAHSLGSLAAISALSPAEQVAQCLSSAVLCLPLCLGAFGAGEQGIGQDYTIILNTEAISRLQRLGSRGPMILWL